MFELFQVNKMDRTNLDFGALIQRETKWIVLSMDHTNSSFVPSVSHNISNIAVIESSDRFVHICNGNTVCYLNCYICKTTANLNLSIKCIMKIIFLND